MSARTFPPGPRGWLSVPDQLTEHGGTIHVIREGRCRRCGMWVQDGVGAHGRLYAPLCPKGPRGPRRYRVDLTISGGSSARHPWASVPALAPLVAQLLDCAKRESRCVHYSVPPGLDARALAELFPGGAQ